MAELDYNYIANLVQHAAPGSADAFAELYASTYQKQYAFAFSFLQEPFLAQEALLETYVTAWKHMSELRDPRLFVSWLSQINFRICYKTASRLRSEAENGSGAPLPEARMFSIRGRSYSLRQVMPLPFSESQAIFLRYCRSMSIRSISSIMEIRRSDVRRYLSSGREHLANQPER